MGRPKCYFCEERHDWDDTRLYRTMTGGSYIRCQASRDVRACYRCIAAQEYKRAFTYARDTITDMAKRGWVLGEDYGDGWTYFSRVLWPYDAREPPDPALIPERLRPPPVGR